MDHYVPVRKMHDDGYITVRYLNPDGSEPEELPEEYTLGATLNETSEIWDVDRYHLWGRGYFFGGGVPRPIANLKYLSDTNPLVFEEVLVYCENNHGVGPDFFKHVLGHKSMVPTERNPHANYHDMYRALMKHADMLMELGKEYAVGMERHNANMMFNDARRIMGEFDTPLFGAAAVAAWIIHRGTGKRVKIKYEDHAEDIQYIDSRLGEAITARYDLARLGSIRKEDVQSMLDRPKPLRVGSL